MYLIHGFLFTIGSFIALTMIFLFLFWMSKKLKKKIIYDSSKLIEALDKTKVNLLESGMYEKVILIDEYITRIKNGLDYSDITKYFKIKKNIRIKTSEDGSTIDFIEYYTIQVI